MRKIFVLAAAFVSIACTANAQCDVKTKFTASKTEFIRSTGDTNVKQEPVIVTVDKQNIDVLIGDGRDELKGNVTDYACNFTDASNGVISFKSVVTDKRGDIRNAAFTIETKNGKVILLMEAKEEETKIRLTIDSHETVD